MLERARVEVEAKHYAAVLRQVIRASGFSVSEIERRLDLGPQSLRRVFNGTTDLKFKHVIGVLRILGMSHEEFFAIAVRATRRRKPRAGGAELLAIFERIGYRGTELLPLDDEDDLPRSEAELNRQIADAVRRVLERRERDTRRRPAEKPDPDQPEVEKGDGEGAGPE
jgi:hypothetical protein